MNGRNLIYLPIILLFIAIFVVITGIAYATPNHDDANSGKDAGSTIDTSIELKTDDWYSGDLFISSGDKSDIYKFYAKKNQTIQIYISWDEGSYGGGLELLDNRNNVLLSGSKDVSELPASYTGYYYINLKYTSTWGSTEKIGYSFAIKLISAPDDFTPQPRKYWTYMMYISGSGGLTGEAFTEMDNFQSLGSTREVNLLVLYDGDPKDDSKLIYYTQQKTVKRIKLSMLDPSYNDVMELNMGDPNLAIGFMRFAIKYLPAEHYAIVFSGHAGGVGGFAKDSDPYDKITTPEISTIFSPIRAMLGKNIDMVAIDSCWAGSIENYYELSEYADYAIASEPTMRGAPYGSIVEALMENPRMDGYRLAVLQMSYYNDYYSDESEDSRDFVNAINLGVLRTELKEKLNKFVDTLINTDSKKIIEVRERTKSAGTGTYKDWGHFALLSKDVAELKKIASETFATIKKTVIQENYNPPKDYYGISIYFPMESHSGYYSDHFGEYKQTKFGRETKWVKLLEYIMMGGIELELGIPKSNLFKLEDRTEAKHYYAVKRTTYTGEDPFVVMIKTSNMEEVKRIGVTLLMNSGDTYYSANWETVATIQPNAEGNNGILVLPKEKMNGEREFKISLVLRGQVEETLAYSVAAYGKFEKVNENNMEQLAWSGNGVMVESKFEKTNEEKYYWLSVPANTKINIKLKCIEALANETDFDIYVGIAPPYGTGIPRIYKFEYRGFTIDANETIPMNGGLGPYQETAKVYILVRAYQGKGKYSLVVEKYG